MFVCLSETNGAVFSQLMSLLHDTAQKSSDSSSSTTLGLILWVINWLIDIYITSVAKHTTQCKHGNWTRSKCHKPFTTRLCHWRYQTDDWTVAPNQRTPLRPGATHWHATDLITHQSSTIYVNSAEGTTTASGSETRWWCTAKATSRRSLANNTRRGFDWLPDGWHHWWWGTDWANNYNNETNFTLWWSPTTSQSKW